MILFCRAPSDPAILVPDWYQMNGNSSDRFLCLFFQIEVLYLLSFMSWLLSQAFLRIAVIKTACWWTASSSTRSFRVRACSPISSARDTLTFTVTSDGSASTSDFQVIVPISVSPFLLSKPSCCRRKMARKSHLYFNLFMHNMSGIRKAVPASLSPCVRWSNRQANKLVVTCLCRPVKP